MNINKKQSKIDKINGFYGLVGPNVDISKTNTLFELFTGDGIIQGVFLENGEINEISHIIQTEKIKYERQNGKFLNNMMLLPMYMFLNKMGMIPNIMGLANTAFLQIENKKYVLFERDLPYEITLDFERKRVETLKKMDIDYIEHFSAHSTVDRYNRVFSLEYNVLNNIVSLLHMNQDLGLVKRINVNTNYVPIVHDSYILSNSTIFTDSPLKMSLKHLIKGKIPVVFDNTKPTFIHEISRETGSKRTYQSNASFYIFHYADMREMDKTIEILAPIYDDLDFSALDINGKYRRLILDKETKTVEIQKNPELEKYNLDFPMKWRDSVILRNIENMRINGFIICRGLYIQRKIFLENLSVCGEPQIYDDGTFSRIMCLGYDRDMNGYFILIDPQDGKVFEFPLKMKTNIGFHSVFVKNNIKNK
jgi:carotenoid cleavage dioxygenase-like enzyme